MNQFVQFLLVFIKLNIKHKHLSILLFKLKAYIQLGLPRDIYYSAFSNWQSIAYFCLQNRLEAIYYYKAYLTCIHLHIFSADNSSEEQHISILLWAYAI